MPPSASVSSNDRPELSPTTLLALAAALLALMLLAGCDMPRDPAETWERVRGGTIRAGITDNEPWTRFRDGAASGIEAGLLERFAEELDADVEWTYDSEGKLLEALHRGELDVVAAGLKSSTPWSKQVGLTQWYVKAGGDKHVLAVPHGENRWLLELDRFLQRESDHARQQLEAEGVQ